MATSSIKASSGDYSTIDGWEADTDNDLETAEEGEIGELYSETYTTTYAIVIAGATTTADYRRILRATSGAERDVRAGTGALVSSNHASNVIDCDENHARFYGFGIHRPYATLSGSGIRNTGTGAESQEFDRLTFTEVQPTSVTDANASCLKLPTTSANGPIITRCLFIGTGHASLGLRRGIAMGGSTGALVYNNVAYGFMRTSDGCGIDVGAAGTTVKNNICAGCTAAYDFGSSTHDYNCADDTTTSGESNGLASKSSAATFNDAASDDFRLLSTSDCVDAGDDLSATLTADYDGVTWGTESDWHMGAYDTTVSEESEEEVITHTDTLELLENDFDVDDPSVPDEWPAPLVGLSGAYSGPGGPEELLLTVMIPGSGEPGAY